MKDNDPLLGLIGSQQDREESAPAEPAGSIVDNVAGAEANVEPTPSAEAIHEALADNLRDRAGPAFAYPLVASSIAAGITPEAFVEFRRRFLEDCGSPTDPLVILMIDQLLIAHFAVGRLQFQSVMAKTANAAVAYASCAARLLGEFRRSVLAVDVLRSKKPVPDEQPASTEGTEKAASAKRNGKPRRSVNGRKPSANGKKPVSRKKKVAYTKVTNNGKIPQCLQDRMRPPIPAVLQPAGVTGLSGRG
jgi:hypothetical protein